LHTGSWDSPEERWMITMGKRAVVICIRRCFHNEP